MKRTCPKLQRTFALVLPGSAVAALLSAGMLEGATVPEAPTCSSGWKLELIAEAPKVRHPSFLTCAPDGRVFVGEDPMDISAAADQTLGRILCFHPDGRVTVFADTLHAPFGLLYMDGKLYVHHSPRFSVFTDGGDTGTNRVDLIECTNPKPWEKDWNDHVPANIRPAMDGFLYMSVGDKGIHGAVGRDGKSAQLHGGGVLRLRPDATELEVFSTGTRNHLDVAINAEDEIFTYDNTDEKDWWSRLTHMVDGGYYGYPWDHKPRRPYTLWMMDDFGSGAATATLAYAEDALPAEYFGSLFLADFGKRQVLRVRVARDGATYKVLTREDLFVNIPADFRPVGLALAPDGMSIYIGDWQHRDVKANVEVGRLWKLTYTGPSGAAAKPAWYLPAAMGRKFEAPAAALIEGLSHPAQSVRMVAQRRLVDLGSGAVEPLLAVLGDARAAAHARWHSLWALDAIDGGVAGRKAILEALRDGDASLRRQAARQVGTRRVAEAADGLMALLEDPDAAVRFQAATALGRIGDAAAVPALRDGLDEKDSFTRYAVFTALNRIGRARPDAWDSIAKGLQSAESSIRDGTLLAMRETYETPVVTALATAARSRALPPEARAAVLEGLAQLHRQTPPWRGEWWAYHPVTLPRPAKTVAWAGTPDVLATLRAGLDDPEPRVRQASVEGLITARDAEAVPELRGRFPTETDGEVRRSLLRVLGSFQDAASEDLFASVLQDPKNDADLLVEAVRAAEQIAADALLASFLRSRPRASEALLATIQALGNLKAAEAFPLLAEHLEHPDGTVRVAAVGALAQLGGERTIDVIVPLLIEKDVEVRKAAIRALGILKNKKAAAALYQAFLQEETRFEAASALAQMPEVGALDAYLYGLGSLSYELRESSRQALTSIQEEALPLVESRLKAAALSPRVIEELQSIYSEFKGSRLLQVPVNRLDPLSYLEYALENAGDPVRGRTLYWDAQGVACGKCHRVGGEGGDSGPDLSGIGVQAPRKELAESILDPSKAVREGYQQTIVLTTSGRSLAGLVRGETARELTLVDAEGQLHRLGKHEIEERQTSSRSLMPDGLHTGLSLSDFADLVAFLESLKAKPKE